MDQRLGGTRPRIQKYKKKSSHTHARALAHRTQSHMSLFRIAIQRQSKHAVAGGTTHAIPTFCVVVYFFILTSVKAMNKTKNNRRKLDHNKSGCWLCDRTFAVLKTTLKSICSHQHFIVLRPSKVTCGNICGSSICVWLWFEFESNSVQYISIYDSVRFWIYGMSSISKHSVCVWKVQMCGWLKILSVYRLHLRFQHWVCESNKICVQCQKYGEHSKARLADESIVCL